MRAPILAVLFVLMGASDWGLDIAGADMACAKDRESCERARQAIRHGWLDGIPRDTPTLCRPEPGCFSERSNTIPGYNGPR